MQRDDPSVERKRNFNIALGLMVMHQRGLVIPMRKNWGHEAIGMPCALAFVVMCLWAGLSGDMLMWAWVGWWVIQQGRCRVESIKARRNGERIHSHYDGVPFDAMRFVKSEKVAKLLVEPLMVGILGGVLYFAYKEFGLQVHGLPCFMLLGLVSLPFVELVKHQIRERRVQGMLDARIENESLMEEVRDRMREL